MKRLNLRKQILLLLALFATTYISAQSLTFNVTTVTYDGRYSPSHIFALWITKADGTYIKTINRQSYSYTYYLTQWKTDSKANMTDGQTGASLDEHNYPYSSGTTSRIPFKWDCKDYKGAAVPDGDYYVNVEFTEEDATGKFIQYAFTKGASSKTINFPNVSTAPGVYFRNATLTYTAPSSAITLVPDNQAYELFYNPYSKSLQISYDNLQHKQVKLLVFDATGKLLQNRNIASAPQTLALNKLNAGIYIVKLTDADNISVSRKILVK